MLSSTQRQGNKVSTKRPFSAVTARSHHKEYRLTDQQSLNNIKSNINETFSNENRYLKEVHHLTSTIDRKYEKRINRMCVTYSICKNPSRQRRTFEGIDVDFITRKYVDSKSKEKKKQEERQLLKKEVNKISRRYIKRQPKQFFKFDIQTLREMENREKNRSKRKSSHPYLSIYEQSQIQALNCLTDRNELNLGEISSYPTIGEQEQWEKDHKQVKSIYQGVSLFRREKMKSTLRNDTNSERDHFFIT